MTKSERSPLDGNRAARMPVDPLVQIPEKLRTLQKVTPFTSKQWQRAMLYHGLFALAEALWIAACLATWAGLLPSDKKWGLFLAAVSLGHTFRSPS